MTPSLRRLPLVAVLLAAPTSAQVATGITFGGELVAVDLGTGARTPIAATGLGDGNQVAAGLDGTLYAILEGGDELHTLDPSDGSTSLVATIGLDEVRALAVHPHTGLLYALVDQTVTASPFDEIWTIDLAGPTVTLLGETDRYGIQGLDFAPDGTLYGWDISGFPPGGDGLVTIDLSTGFATTVGPGFQNGWVYQWLCVIDDTTAYVGGVDYELVDLTTGGTTPLGTLGLPQIQGLDLDFNPIGATLCAGQPSSTGLPATLVASGSTSIAHDLLRLEVSDLPPNQFGIFVMGQNTGAIAVGQGILCLGLPFVRFSDDILSSGAAGSVFFQPALTSLPQSTTFLPASTWHFQYWTRDVNPTQTSNLSGAVSVTFQ